MNFRPGRPFTIALACAVLLAGSHPPPVCAAGTGHADTITDQSKDAAAKLKTLHKAIKSTRADKAQTESSLNAATASLRKHELAMAAASNRLRNIRQMIDAKNARLEKLNELKARRSGDLARHRQALAGELRAAYMMGGQSTLKLILNQEDPLKIERVLVYHGYFAHEQLQKIQAVNADIRQINQFSQAIKLETGTLRQLQSKQQQTLQVLESERAQRRLAMEKLQSRLKNEKDRLRHLRANAKRLKDLLQSLAAKQSELEHGGAPFAQLKGRLAWPVKGRITAPYGGRRTSGINSHGVLIEAAAGTEVHAVAAGRVVFADWFQPLGLLIIIDHGDGYMSLYGHDQSLQTKLGEIVHAGQAIATVGDSGGRSDAGLYFEIRKQGKPVDPAKWCHQEPPRQR